MKSILITGCNRGIGLGIIKNLLNRNDTPKYVIGTCRNLDKATVSSTFFFSFFCWFTFFFFL